VTRGMRVPWTLRVCLSSRPPGCLRCSGLPCLSMSSPASAPRLLVASRFRTTFRYGIPCAMAVVLGWGAQVGAATARTHSMTLEQTIDAMCDSGSAPIRFDDIEIGSDTIAAIERMGSLLAQETSEARRNALIDLVKGYLPGVHWIREPRIVAALLRGGRARSDAAAEDAAKRNSASAGGRIARPSKRPARWSTVSAPHPSSHPPVPPGRCSSDGGCAGMG
jgi:hypothetical protein